MTWQRGRGDRRGTTRFEVLGTLHGTVATSQPVQARNLSDGGVLVESPCTIPLDSALTLKVTAPDLETDVEACVRHVISDPVAGAFIGFEFLTVSPVLLQYVRDWLASLADPPLPPAGMPGLELRSGH